MARILRTISPALDPVTHLGKVPQCLVEEALDATPCAVSPIGGYDERHVGLIMSDLVQSDVCPLSKMQLGRGPHLGHPANMRNECDTAACALPPGSEPAGYQ